MCSAYVCADHDNDDVVYKCMHVSVGCYKNLYSILGVQLASYIAILSASSS